MKRVLEPEVMESKPEAISFDSYQKKTMLNWWAKLSKEFDRFKIRPNSKILDVAAGPANFSIKLAKHYKSKVWATDLSNEMLKIARKNVKTQKAQGKVIVIKDDAKKMKFKDNYFDFVFCRYTLHQIPNPLKVVNEIWRVTKKGGKMQIVDAIRPKTKKEIEKRINEQKPLYKKLKIKNWEVLLKNSKESIASGLSKREILNLFKKSKIKKYKLNFENFKRGKTHIRLFNLTATKK